ncbi:MAG: type 4a pilus biogenesis protein PilO [Myxococcales bacterium]|nr:type 4a pilus biogenesis protein PilO [Myxococcales bacterium]
MEQLIDRINKLATPMKAAIVLGIAVLITGTCYFLLVTDVEARIETIKSQQAAADRTLAEKQAIADNLNERRKEMDALEQRLAEALTELPEKKDIEELLAQLNDVGKKSGLEIAKVTPGLEAPEGFYARIPITIIVSGNYHEIAMFLQEIANMRRIVNVNNIKLANPTLKNDKVILNSEFLATTFRFNEQQQKKSEPKKGGMGK